MRLSLTFICLLFVLQGVASDATGQFQVTDRLPEVSGFGDIPDSLFHRQPDHDYPFEYLLNRVETRFTTRADRVVAILEYHYRVKVFSDDPNLMAEAALVGIPYYFADDLEEIIQIEGATYQPDGTVTELDEEEIRTADLNSRYKIKEFIMPDIQKGSIFEYRYVVHRRYIEELPDFYFSNRVPTRLAHASIRNENYLRYEAVGSNLEFDVFYREVNTDTSSIPLVFSFRRPEPVSEEHWFASDIPAVDNEAYISSINDLRGQLNFQLSEFGHPRQPLINSWEIVAAQLRRGHENPYRLVEEMEELRGLGRELAAGKSDKKEILSTIFTHVNQRKMFNEIPGAFPDSPPETVLDGEPAGQASINLVLLAMLRGAELEAKPLYISGRNFGRINKEFPSIYQFNQMLVAVAIDEGDEGFILMDASFSNSRPGLIPVNSYNEKGFVFKEAGFEWIDMQPEYSRFDIDVDITADLSREGDLSGTIRVLTSGYPVHEIREDLSGQSDARNIIRDAFFDTYADIHIDNAEIREQEPGEFPLSLTADFTIPGYAISFREGLQFRPMVVGYLQRNPFDESERQAPVTLDAPEIIHVRYDIRLPSGFMVESTQGGNTTRMRGAELVEQYDISDNTLKYVFDININRREFPSDEYRELRRVYDRWVFLSNDEWYIQMRTDL